MPIYMSPAEGQGLANWTRGLMAGGCLYCRHLMTTVHIGQISTSGLRRGRGKISRSTPCTALESKEDFRSRLTHHLAGGVSSFPSRASSKRNPQLRWFPRQRASTSSTATFFGAPFAYAHGSLNPPSPSHNPQNTD